MVDIILKYFVGIFFSIFPFLKNTKVTPKGNYEVNTRKNFKVNVEVDTLTSTVHIDWSMIKNLKMTGLESIQFNESIKISSDKHLAVESGWKHSNNGYKVLVNPETEEYQTLDDYVIKLIEKEKNKKQHLVKEVVIDTIPKAKKVLIPKNSKEVIKSNMPESLNRNKVHHNICLTCGKSHEDFGTFCG